MNKKIFFLLFFFIISSTSIYSEPEYNINSYVVDNAYVFDEATRLDLENLLKQFETESGGVQIVVYTENKVPEGMTLEERSLQIAENNKLGTEKDDNGLLFYLATEDREFRWEVGYGLEPILNSAWLGRISRDYMIPEFKEGDYALGILKGLEQVESKILNNSEYNEQSSITITNNNNLPMFDKLLLWILSDPLLTILIIIILINIIKIILRKKGYITDDSYYHKSASNIFSGGFGRGGGGFSGGGGSFGGGGHSGKF